MSHLLRAAASTAGAAPYTISRSLRFNSADNTYLSRTPGSAGNKQIMTISFWTKRVTTALHVVMSSGSSTSAITEIGFDSNGSFFSYGLANGAHNMISAPLYRDYGAWLHVCIAYDTTQATAANRIKAWVNGSAISFGTATYPTQNSNLYFSDTYAHYIGCFVNGNYDYNGYLADVCMIDGQALDATSFGETDSATGQWIPKSLAGLTPGTNGFWLKFDDYTSTTTIGYDSLGSNNFTTSGFSVTAGAGNDSLSDTPTENYCILNPLDNGFTGLTNGALALTSSAYDKRVKGTHLLTGGKWYFESLMTTATGGGSRSCMVGVGIPTLLTAETNAHWNANQWLIGADGNKYNTSNSALLTAFSSGDIRQIAVDVGAGKIWFGRNGTWSGDPAAGTGEAFSGLPSTVIPIVASGDASFVEDLNFGQRAFSYTPPSGFVAIKASSLSDPATGKKSTTYANAVLWTGSGATKSVTGAGHQPDFVWIKNRTDASTNHRLFDSARGVQNAIFPNLNNQETAESNSLTSFDTDGFSLGSGASSDVNTNAKNYIAFLLKESATAGFDIVTGTKSTANAEAFNHSLGVKPEWMFVKQRDTATKDGLNTHKSYGTNMQDYYNNLFANTAITNSAGYWGGEPTSSQFTITTSVVSQNATFVAYLFASVPGFSRFGSYTGNAAADGTFVPLGFLPAWGFIKALTGTGTFYLFDYQRLGYNAANYNFAAGGTAADATTAILDIVSNGIKLRSTSVGNASGVTYAYGFFARYPFKYARAR